MHNRVYIKRIRLGLTQQELAERAGVSRRTVNALETTGRFPSFRVGVRLCRALGCSVEEVFPCDVLL